MSLRQLAILATILLPALGLAQPPVKPRLDAHGFPLPEGAFARIGNLHFAQTHDILQVAVSPDGKWVATTGAPLRRLHTFTDHPTAVTVFDGATGRSKHTFSSSLYIEGIRFSPSGKLLAIRHRYGATILDVTTGKHEFWPPLDARERDLIYVGFVNDEQSVVTCGANQHIRIWDRKTGKLQRDWTSEDGKVPALKLAATDKITVVPLVAHLSPSGQWMAWQLAKSSVMTESHQTRTNYDIHVFNTWTGEPKGIIRDVDGFRQEFGFLDEGETIYCREVLEKEVEGRDGDAVFKSSQVFRAMDVKTGRERFRIHGSVHNITLTGDGKTFWAFNGDSNIVRRELLTGLPLGKMVYAYSYRTRRFTAAPDGKRTIVTDHARWAWGDLDLKPLQPWTELNLTDTDAVWESNRLIRVHGSDKTRKIWDVVDGKFVETIKTEWDQAGPRAMAMLSKQRKLVVYRSGDKLMIADLQRAADPVPLPLGGSPEVSADERRILIHNVQYVLDERLPGLMVSWYDSETGNLLGYFPISHKELYPHAHWSPSKWFADDGSEFAYPTRDHQLAVVDCATRKVRLVIGKPRPYTGLVRHVPEWRYQIEPGRPFVSGQGWQSPAPIKEDAFNTVPSEHAVYDKATGAMVRRFLLPPPIRPNIWDRATDGGYGPIYSWPTTYSHDHRLFLCRTSLDGDLTVFETATARPLGVIRTGVGANLRLKVSPDGKTLAVGCVDTTTLLFNLDRPFSDKPIPPAPKTAKEAADLWDTLGHADPREAEPAIWALARAPALAQETAKERLPRATQFPDAKQFKIWIDRLDSANFKIREEAMQNLRRVGQPALPSLQEALPKADNLELRRRIEALIASIEQPVQADGLGAMAPCLLGLRALEMLERIGTAEARKLIETVTGGSNNGVLGHEARLILARWQPSSNSNPMKK